MLRKLAFLFLFLIFGAIGYLGYSIYDKMQERKAVEKRIALLPSFSVNDLDGHAFKSENAINKGPVILTYFNTGCHFCQAEIRSMAQHDSLHDQATVYLVSDEFSPLLKQFNNKFKLDSLQNIHILQDSSKQLKKMFGVRGVPSTFVYGADGNLLKSFEGETKAQVLYELVK